MKNSNVFLIVFLLLGSDQTGHRACLSI